MVGLCEYLRGATWRDMTHHFEQAFAAYVRHATDGNKEGSPSADTPVVSSSPPSPASPPSPSSRGGAQTLGIRLATRSTLLHAECMRRRPEYFGATQVAGTLRRASVRETPLASAVLLEQAATRFLDLVPDGSFFRKHAFYSAMAAGMYSRARLPRHALRGYVAAMGAFEETQWRSALAFLRLSVGRFLHALGDPGAAAFQFAALARAAADPRHQRPGGSSSPASPKRRSDVRAHLELLADTTRAIAYRGASALPLDGVPLPVVHDDDIVVRASGEASEQALDEAVGDDVEDDGDAHGDDTDADDASRNAFAEREAVQGVGRGLNPVNGTAGPFHPPNLIAPRPLRGATESLPAWERAGVPEAAARDSGALRRFVEASLLDEMRQEEATASSGRWSAAPRLPPTLLPRSAVVARVRVLPAGESIAVAVPVTNPLAVSLHLRDVTLLWRMEPDDALAESLAESGGGGVEPVRAAVSNEATEGGDQGEGAAFTVVQTTGVAEIKLSPGERCTLRLRARPLQAGRLELTGMQWRIVPVGAESQGRHATGEPATPPLVHRFAVPGPLLHATRQQRATGARTPDRRLQARVVGTAPLLRAHLRHAPSTVLYGELCRFDLVLRNEGSAEADDLKLVSSVPAVCVGKVDVRARPRVHSLPHPIAPP